MGIPQTNPHATSPIAGNQSAIGLVSCELGCGILINRLAKFHQIEDEEEEGHENLNEDEEESERAKDEETEVANGEEEN